MADKFGLARSILTKARSNGDITQAFHDFILSLAEGDYDGSEVD